MRPNSRTQAAFKFALLGGDGCWEWTAAKLDGYGVTKALGKSYKVHRLAYELLVGPIPPGLTIDHLCRNRACLRPSHLEVVTHRVNILRGLTKAAANVAKTHCPKGHPLASGNLVLHLLRQSPPRRQCLICARAYSRKYESAKREASRG